MNFYKKEIVTNCLIILIGLLLATLPVIIIKDITVPVSVISVSIGCSLIATGISVLLSFIYKERNTEFYDYLTQIGLSNILIGRSSYDYFLQALQKSKCNIYIAQIGAPVIILHNKELFVKLICSGVCIKVLINVDQFEKDIYFPSYTNHDKIAREEFYMFAKEIGIEIRETDYPLTRTLIIDNEAILLNNRVGGHQVSSFVYIKNKTDMSFYYYQLDQFQNIWNVSKNFNSLSIQK